MVERNSPISRLGIASLLGFVVSQAVRDVHLGHLFGNLGLYEVALMAFGTAALVCGGGLLLFKRRQIGLLRRNWPMVAALNITTAVSWLSYFQSLRMVEPAAVNLAFSGVSPAMVTLVAGMGLTSAGERHPSAFEKGLHLALLGTIAALALIVCAGFSGFTGIDPSTGLAGVALAAFAGVSITIEMIFAKRLNMIGVSPAAIIGVRFLLVTSIAAVMTFRLADPYAGMTILDLGRQAGIFLLILIGPIYLVQAGIALTTPLVGGVVCALGPVAILAAQWFVSGIRFAPAMLGIALLYAGLSIAAVFVSAKPTSLSPASRSAA